MDNPKKEAQTFLKNAFEKCEELRSIIESNIFAKLALSPFKIVVSFLYEENSDFEWHFLVSVNKHLNENLLNVLPKEHLGYPVKYIYEENPSMHIRLSFLENSYWVSK